MQIIIGKTVYNGKHLLDYRGFDIYEINSQHGKYCSVKRSDKSYITCNDSIDRLKKYIDFDIDNP